MINYLLEKIKSILTSRLFWVAIVYSFLTFVLIQCMFELQIVQGEETSQKEEYLNVKERYIPSTRGLIYDKNGKLLAYNELSYSVLLEDSAVDSGNAGKNAMIHELLTILKEHGYELELDFAIELDENGELCFNVSGTAELRFKKNAYGLRSVNLLSEKQREATAQEVFDFLRYGNKSSAMFQVSDDYTLEEALEIITVRYHFFTMVDKSSQLTIASGIDDETIAAIMEASGDIAGVSVVQRTKRVYNYSKYFAHIIGYTGMVTEDDLERLNADGGNYTTSDYVGKTGLEKEMEQVLSGTKGLERITLNSSGKVVSTEVVSEPVPGESIYLTLDADLQVAYYYIIEKNLANILCQKIVQDLDYGTKGESSENITIPVYEVYYALFNNHVLSLDSLSSEDATELEQKVYGYYLNKRDSVIDGLYDYMQYGSTKLRSRLSEEMQSYLSYFYSRMQELNLLPKQNINTSDSMYQAYQNNTISLPQFLTYCINNNWVNLEALGVGDSYYSTDEIYEILLDKTFDSLFENEVFDLKIYHDLIFNNKLSGKEICLLLFDQNVLEYQEEDITNLRRGRISAYDFIIEKIRNVEITPAQLALEPCSGSVVQTDAKTGAVIAMVTYPSYDNNMLANKIDWTYYSTLLADKSNPLYNRATQQRTTTGSSIKMMTSVAGLLNGAVTINEKIFDEITFTKIVPSPSCWSSRGHKYQDISSAIMNSCNYFFYEVGYRLSTDSSGKYVDSLGISKLKAAGELFGFNSTSGIELGEAEPEFSTVDAVRSAIGYGYKFTPTQISRYANTLATKGDLYKYTLIQKIVDKDGTVVMESEPVIESTIEKIKNSEWKKIYEGMEKVITTYSATLRDAYANLPVSVAGKTGSAQVSESLPAHAVFVSFAPSTNPETSVVAVIANGYSGTFSGLLCRDIYGYYYNGEFREYLEQAEKEELQ
ncbi:MAG: penicillin-binding transpeptidase domain-containing protein [Lachnospiraceae bacterium]